MKKMIDFEPKKVYYKAIKEKTIFNKKSGNNYVGNR